MKFYPNIKQKTRDNAFTRGMAEGRITQDDVDLIRFYVAEYQASAHVKEHRVQKTTLDLIQWRRFIHVPYRAATIGQIFEAINAIQTEDSLIGKPFAQNTKHDYVKALRLFLIWLIENQYSSIPLVKVKAIRIPDRDHTTITPDMILTPEEVRSIIDACQDSRDRSRDRAIIATLYESGCRVGELARLAWRDVVFDEYGVKLTVTDKKTNKIRYCRLVMASEYLTGWKNDTHGSRAADAPVFTSSQGNGMDYPGLYAVVKRTSERAGITKRVSPHLFRHSRITHLIQQNFQESVIKQMMWGNLNTNMFRTYVSLSNADIDDEVLDRYNVRKKEETKTDKLEPRQCPNCLKVHAPTTRYCTCGMPLCLEAMSSREAMREALKEDPESVLKLIRELIGVTTEGT